MADPHSPATGRRRRSDVPAPVPAQSGSPEPATEAPTFDPEALLREIEAMDASTLGALMAAGRVREPRAGEEIEGEVVRVTADGAFVDVGAKAEALLAREDLAGEAPPKMGERVRAFVIATGHGGIRLARTIGSRGGEQALEQAWRSRVPVEGRVEGRNPGGFDVRAAGTLAFCPVSQIDLHPEVDLDAYVGKAFAFLVTSVRGSDAVLSRRALQEEEGRKVADLLWSTLAPGQRKQGVVTTVQEFGAFVDVGGVTGLVHKSEFGYDGDEIPPVKGQRVEVEVIEIDLARKRLSLSLRSAAASSASVDIATTGGRQSLGTFADLMSGIEVHPSKSKPAKPSQNKRRAR